jgi:hypothetical protein
MKALKALGGQKAEIQDGLPIPTLRPDYVTVKVVAVGTLLYIMSTVALYSDIHLKL